MVLARWQATVTDEQGNVLPGATVTVRREVTGTPLAALFADRDGLVPLGNPFPADPEGFAAFHVAGGAYQIAATQGAFTRSWRYVGIGTAAEADASGGDVSGPAGGVADGEYALFNGATGKAIKGGKTAADAAAVRAAAPNRVLEAGLIASASAPVALADAATVAINWNAGINFTLTAAGNRSIGNPTNGQPGTWRTVMVAGNDATARTITFGNQFLGELPTITDCTAARWYLLTIFCVSATHFLVSAKRALG